MCLIEQPLHVHPGAIHYNGKALTKANSEALNCCEVD